MELSPTHFWLTGIKYLEERRSVAIAFSQLKNKRTVRLPLFPSFFVGKKILPIETLGKILSLEGSRFKLDEKENSFRVSASTFSQLQAIANVLFNETGFRPLVVEPARQFLLENGFSFFDCFTFTSEKEFLKSSSFQVPDAKLDFFSEPLPETLRQLIKENLEIARKTVESIALSHLLQLPISGLPSSGFMQLEKLLEGIFWETGLGTRNHCQETCLASSHRNFSAFPGLLEVDFSLLWPTLLTKPIYNLGPSSLDCNCCKPGSLLEKNVLPSSLVEVEMLQDGFFFESGLRAFSKGFHERMPARESRLRRKQEFCLKSIPLGPFFRFQKVSLPLVDATGLCGRNQAKIVASRELHWFCLRSESRISKAVAGLNKQISLSENSVEKMRLSALKEFGVLSNSALSKNTGFLFQQAFLNAFSDFLKAIPLHLCNEKSAFFSPNLCTAIESIEASLLEKFAEFASSRKSRVVSFSQSKAFVQSDKPYSLIKQFSEKQRIPALITARSR